MNRSVSLPPSGRTHSGEPSRRQVRGPLQVRPLLGRRLLGRAHPLPRLEGVAVVPVDAEVLQQHGAVPGGQAGQRQLDVRRRARHVVVVVVPGQDADLAVPQARQGRDVGLAPHAVLADRLQADLARALDGQPLAAHQAEHAEDVQHRQRDAVGREHPEPGEVRLVLELEGPRHRPLEVDAVLLGQGVLAGERGGGVAGVERAVAIAVLRVDRRGAGGAAVRVASRR